MPEDLINAIAPIIVALFVLAIVGAAHLISLVL